MQEPSSMDDEIDIEEHDVLDNPRIKSIFPDLAKVKVEPEEVEHILSDDPDQNQEMLYPYEYNYRKQQYETVNNPPIYDNAIILGSKPSIDYDALYDEALNSNPSVYLENWQEKLVKSPCFCQDCDILFPTVNALDAHKMINHSFLIALDVRPNTARKSTVTSKYCNHCDKTFPNDTALIKHLYELLPLSNFEKTVKKEVEESIPDKKPKYSCIICFKTFFSYYETRMHKKKEHLQEQGKKRLYIIKKLDETENKNNEFVKNLKIIPSTSNPIPIQKPKIKTEPGIQKPKLSNVNRKFFSDKLVSKVMFRCDTCQTNFLSCFSALQHWMRCNNDNDDSSNKCAKCKRKIRNRDAKIHQLQHKYVDKFKIYKVHKSLYEHVLCKCPKCNIYFDEICFWTHLDKCGNVKSKRCEECNINIYINKYQSHKQGHELKKYTKKSLIFIEFYSNKPERKKRQVNSKLLFYCQHCGCCNHRSICKSHTDKSCKTKSRKYCDICGLYFTAKSYTTHLRLHELYQLSLKDFRFKNLFTYTYIDTPLPNYYYCNKCKIHVTTYFHLKSHKCNKEITKTCSFCSKKIAIEAFEAHMNFHDLKNDEFSSIPIPELLKKYNSINNMWNVVFRCKDCDLMTSSYDSIVQHCQKHINNCQDVLEICEICDFEFVASCYKSHEMLHDNNDSLDRKSFKIISYDYRNLFANNWEAFLKELPVEHKTQIMSKSLYRYSRIFRLHANNPTFPLRGYCMRCHRTIPPELINKHTNCPPNDKFPCSFCSITFTSHQNLILHQNKYHPDKNRSLITFNLEEDEDFNQKLRQFHLQSIKNEKSIVPILKTVKKVTQLKQDESNLSDSSVVDLQSGNVKPYYDISGLALSADEKVRFRPTIYQNKLVLYKCVICKCCSIYKLFVKTHRACRDTDAKSVCPICDEYVLDKIAPRHKRVHDLFPDLTKESLQIYYFAKSTILQNKSEKKIVKKISKAKRGYYKDDTYSPRSKTSRTLTPKTDAEDLSKSAQIFKCTSCGLHYTSKRLVEKHIEICDENLEISKETCSKCNLLFPTEVLVTHLCNHHSKTTNIVITNVRKVTLGQCAECQVCFVYKSDYDHHACHVDSKTCDTCHYTFSNSRFSRHLCSDNNTMYVFNLVPYQSKCVVYRCPKCNICYLNKKSYSYHIEVNHRSCRDIHPCSVCGLNFTQISMRKHSKQHEGTDTYTIHLKNGVTREETILTGDNVLQSKKRKLDSKSESSSKKVKHTSLSETDDESQSCDKSDNVVDKSDQVSEKSDIDTSYIEEEVKTKTVKPNAKSSYFHCKLYKCIACDLHYLKPSSLYYHMKYFDHKNPLPQSEKCASCGLTFPRNSLTRHTFAHHKKLHLKVENFRIDTEYSKYLGVIDTTECDKNETDLDENTENDASISEKSDVNKTSGIKESDVVGTSKSDTIKKPSLAEKAKGNTSEDTTANLAVSAKPDSKSDSESENPESDSPKSDKIVYHKCALCNVYFLNKTECFNHVLDHQPLDPISYINCKICNFQFLIESLKEHIVTQHKTAFCLDDIIINEYAPATAVSKVKSYAKDRVQSGLISTTTDGFV